MLLNSSPSANCTILTSADHTVNTLSLYITFMSSHMKPCSVCSDLAGIVYELESSSYPSFCQNSYSTLVVRTFKGFMQWATMEHLLALPATTFHTLPGMPQKLHLNPSFSQVSPCPTRCTVWPSVYRSILPH